MLFTQKPGQSWTFANKLAFRFIATYLVMYIVLMFISFLIESPLRLFAEHILNWDADFSMESTGSGDRTFDYVRLFFNLFITIPTASLWSWLDRKRVSYDAAFYWFLLFLRVILGIAMILYGLAKIIKGQFPDPALEQLIQPVGDLSPMGLAWTFMGHSFYYNLFIGVAEALGGVLLLYRRTTTLGSLIIIGVMSNVAIMNFTYDIPVKQFSAHLVLMAIVLAASDARRLIQFFIKNQSVESITPYTPLIPGGLLKITGGLRGLAVVVLTLVVLFQSVAKFEATEQLRSNSEFFGIWQVSSFAIDGEERPPLLTDTQRWRYFIVDQKRKATVKHMDDTIKRFSFQLEDNQIVFEGDSKQHYTYQFTDPESLSLINETDRIEIKLTRVPTDQFRLLNRGFHWINEKPYNH